MRFVLAVAALVALCVGMADANGPRGRVVVNRGFRNNVVVVNNRAFNRNVVFARGFGVNFFTPRFAVRQRVFVQPSFIGVNSFGVNAFGGYGVNSFNAFDVGGCNCVNSAFVPSAFVVRSRVCH